MTEPVERTLEDTAAVLGTDARGVLVATRALVRVAEGPDQGREILLERGSIVVGSGAGADLVLADPRVSRAHLELALMPRGVRVRDLGSRNGTFVAGTRLRDATLPLGSTVTVGRTSLVLLGDTAPVPIVPRSALGPLRAASESLCLVFGVAAQIVRSRVAVLVEGETGVGKTALVRAIHELDGGAIREIDLRLAWDPHALEEELRGALVTMGERDDLTLEHVDEASAMTQRVLAAALERRDVEHPGPRLLATSREDLRQRVSSGAFGRDLYFEIAAVRLVIPPLRDRPEDVPALLEAWVSAGIGAWPPRAALDQLRLSGMHGSTRALRGLAEATRAGLLQTPDAHGADRPKAVTPAPAASGPLEIGFREAKDQAVASFERDYLVRLLAECDGNVSEASRRSGVARSHLVNLLKKHDLG